MPAGGTEAGPRLAAGQTLPQNHFSWLTTLVMVIRTASAARVRAAEISGRP